MIINGGAANGTVVAEEESEVVSMTGGEQVLAEMTLQSGSGETFAAGNETTGTPFDNPGILWGAAATALLGATLADWQRKREEEEASLSWRTVQGKRADAMAGEGEEGGGGGKKTPGQRAYEAMMQQKHIVGESQALLAEKKDPVYIPSQKLEDEETNWLNTFNPVYQYEKRKAELQKQADLQAGLSAYYEGRKAGEEETASTPPQSGLLSNLWNAGMSAVGSVLSLGGGGKPLAMPVALDGTPPPTPLPDGFELGKSPYHSPLSELYDINSFRFDLEDRLPRQYGNLSIFLGPGYSAHHTNLCGQIVVSTLTNIPLKSVLLEYAETPLGAERLKNNTPTKPGEISLLFNNLGWSASVKGLDGNYWYGDEPSPSEIDAYLANGSEVVALVKIDSNNYYGALRPNGKTGHWISIQDIDVQSEKVTIYNPYRDQEQIYEWEDFKEAWQDEGSHTVYNYAAVIASPPASVSFPTTTPTSTPKQFFEQLSGGRK